MHNGTLPGTFAANLRGSLPIRDAKRGDTKSENKRTAPERKSFIDWLRYRVSAEDEELELDDEELGDEEIDGEEYDDEELDGDDDLDLDSDDLEDYDYEEVEGDEDLEDYDYEDEPEEFNDLDGEKELDFDDEEEPGLDALTGRFADFYRMDDEDSEDDEEYDDEEYEEEQEIIQAQGTEAPLSPGGGGKVSAKDRAKMIFQELSQQPNIGRDEIIDRFIKELGITEETARSYYEDLAREEGGDDEQEMQDPNMDDDVGPVDELPGDTEMELSQDEIDAQDPNAQGIIRAVPNAHLVFKRQMEDGSFEELWIYNLGDKMDDALSIRREILNGTDIPRGHTRSENGDQTYSLQTMGNAQLLHITGLQN